MISIKIIKELIFLFLVIIVSPDLSLSMSAESKTPGLEVFLLKKLSKYIKQTFRKKNLILSLDGGSFIFILEWISALDIFLILS